MPPASPATTMYTETLGEQAKRNSIQQPETGRGLDHDAHAARWAHSSPHRRGEGFARAHRRRPEAGALVEPGERETQYLLHLHPGKISV